jgi:aminomethyltransferase
VRLDKGEFIGRDALKRQKEEGVTRTLAMIAFADLAFVPAPGAIITQDGRQVGTMTSADRGYFLGRSLALGYVAPEIAVAGTKVTVTDKSGGAADGEIHLKAPYDPGMARLKE